MLITRRSALKLAASTIAWRSLSNLESCLAGPAGPRRFQVCLAPEAIERDPELLSTVNKAGVETVWLAGFFYGHWPYSLERLAAARALVERLGMEAQIVNVPLGHPGDSLGASDGQFPLTPPRHWRLGQTVDGATHAGTSLHDPATAENVSALHQLHRAGFRRFFLDDDFRLARGPGVIGGCFCPEHRTRFLQRSGYAENRWPELLAQVRERQLSRLVRDWVDFTAGELSAAFRAQQAAVKDGQLGIMVMYLGAEKAGIRLLDYKDTPFRVGELMFDDQSFNRVKGKTDELFSALMHRRFTRPELAFSETTAYPANQLSAAHLAAKLVVSTLADVRNSVFMSGLTPFPRGHWEVLGPAMKTQASLHARLAGHSPRGPFKHFWGEASRYVGNDQPYSLFLALGIPFEVTSQPSPDGWTFLADADAQMASANPLSSPGARFIHRLSSRVQLPQAESVEETLEALFAFKARILPQLSGVPYVEENEPVVCAWYPSTRAVLLWNLQARRRTFTLRHGAHRRAVELDGLAASLVGEIG